MGFLDNAGLTHLWGKIKDSMQDKLTGAAGQVVGFDADGTATAVQGWRNQNLLHNAYFVGGGSQGNSGKFPINQKGKTEYTEPGYTIDRWLSNRATVSIISNGLMITVNDGEANGFLCQRIEPCAFVIGDVYTISILFGNTLRSFSFTLTGEDINVVSPETNDVRIQFVYNDNAETYDVFFFVYGSGNSLLFKAAALEHGPVQTHFHKQGDTWVFNGSPPDYGLELAKCQRYQVAYNYLMHSFDNATFIAVGYAIAATVVRVFVDVPVPLRSAPSIVNTGFKISKTNNVKVDIGTIENLWSPTQNKVAIQAISINNSFTAGEVVFLEAYGGKALILDANL